MTTTTSFKDIIDIPEWRPIAPTVTLFNGGVVATDPRNNEDRHPEIFFTTTTTIDRYSMKNDEWNTDTSKPTLSGATGAGICSIFMPSWGPRGTLAAGATTTSVVLSTALPAAVGVNTLANRGDGRGFKIRIVDNAAGASGKIEERIIVANTGGTTPTIYLDSALSFTPTTGSVYEILSGRLYLLGGGAVQAGIWKYYDVATNSMSGNLSTTNLVSASVEGNLLGLDELLVPVDRAPSEGYFGNLICTARAAGTITGQAAGGDAGVLANEYRNFQIRIVQDTTAPTSVGQRRRITSHTAGASPVYTLASNWTVQPTVGATYVIENDDDKIIYWSNASTTTFNYNISADTWDTTTWAVRSNSGGQGAWVAPSYGLSITDLGAGKTARNSFVYLSRGGATNTVDLFDIAGAATGAWTAAIVVYPNTPNFLVGTSAIYDPSTNSGRYAYINLRGTSRNLRFDVRDRAFEPWAYIPFASSANVPGAKMANCLFIDGSTKLSFITYFRTVASGAFSEVFQCIASR